VCQRNGSVAEITGDPWGEGDGVNTMRSARGKGGMFFPF
jgi:hypothetical protein